MSSRLIVLLALLFFLAAGILAALAGLSHGSDKAKITTATIPVTLSNSTTQVTVTVPVVQAKLPNSAGPAGERALTRIRTVPGPTVFKTSTVTQNHTITESHVVTVPHTVTVTQPGQTHTVTVTQVGETHAVTVTVAGPTVTVASPSVTVTVSNGNGNSGNGNGNSGSDSFCQKHPTNPNC